MSKLRKVVVGSLFIGIGLKSCLIDEVQWFGLIGMVIGICWLLDAFIPSIKKI